MFEASLSNIYKLLWLLMPAGISCVILWPPIKVNKKSSVFENLFDFRQNTAVFTKKLFLYSNDWSILQTFKTNMELLIAMKEWLKLTMLWVVCS